MTALTDVLRDLDRRRTQGRWNLPYENENGFLIIGLVEADGLRVVCELTHSDGKSAWISQDMRTANATLLSCADLVCRMGIALEGLVERIGINGGLGAYKGGPAFVMQDARALLAELAEKVQR